MRSFASVLALVLALSGGLGSHLAAARCAVAAEACSRRPCCARHELDHTVVRGRMACCERAQARAEHPAPPAARDDLPALTALPGPMPANAPVPPVRAVLAAHRRAPPRPTPPLYLAHRSLLL